MTIDEAILHARKVAERNRRDWKNCPAHLEDIKRKDGKSYTCEECADEYEQLAEWLEELKECKDIENQETNGLLKLFNKEVFMIVKNQMYHPILRENVTLSTNVQKAKVVSVGLRNVNDETSVYAWTNLRGHGFSLPALGETVFLTQEQAEQALADME